MDDKDLEKLAEEIGKDYVQPHILVRWLMLYQEISKLPVCIEYLKGNIESSFDYFPFGSILCEQIQDEIERTPENIKYLPNIKEIYKLLSLLSFADIDNKASPERDFAENKAINQITELKIKILDLIYQEKDNFNINLFAKFEKNQTEELIALFKILSNSQKENRLL